MTTLTQPQRDAVCAAYVQANSAVPDIVGELHALHFYGRDMPVVRRQRMIADAVTAAQTLLVALVAAERALNSETVVRLMKEPA